MPKTTAMESSARSSGQARRTALQRTDWPLVFVLLGAATYLYLNLFALPNTPFLLSGDQVYFWMNAQRILHGERIYIDFLQFTPPGTDLLYFVLFKLFGFHIWVTNAAVLALGVALCWLCFSLAGEIMQRRTAIIATALFLVLIYGKALNATHHWFSVLAVMGAVKVCMKKPAFPRIALAGTLLGLASFFNQAHGATALFAFIMFLSWRQSHAKWSSIDLLQNQAFLFLGYTTALLLLSAHFIATVGLKQLWYFQVTHVTKYVVGLSQGQLLGLPDALTWRNLPRLAPYLVVYISLPVVYLVALWRCWRERSNPTFPWDCVVLLSMVGSFLLVEVALSLNWLRLYAVSLPGIILLVWALDQLPRRRHYAVALIGVGIICLAAQQTISAHASHSLRAELPGGAVATAPQTYEKLQWIMLRTRPGEFFLQAGWPGIYLPLQLRNPLYADTVGSLHTANPRDIEQAIQQLEAKHVRFILWTRSLDSQCDPAHPCEDYLTPIRNYISNSYFHARIFPDGDVLWQRNE
jgi:hypothetical protein